MLNSLLVPIYMIWSEVVEWTNTLLHVFPGNLENQRLLVPIQAGLGLF